MQGILLVRLKERHINRLSNTSRGKDRILKIFLSMQRKDRYRTAVS